MTEIESLLLRLLNAVDEVIADKFSVSRNQWAELRAAADEARANLEKCQIDTKPKVEMVRASDIPQTRTCVHTEHCCLEHGCKYGDKDCVVALGHQRQSFPCESCGDPWSEDHEHIELSSIMITRSELEEIRNRDEC